MVDMGLGLSDLHQMTAAYNRASYKLYETIVARKKWAWDLFLNNLTTSAFCPDYTTVYAL